VYFALVVADSGFFMDTQFTISSQALERPTGNSSTEMAIVFFWISRALYIVPYWVLLNSIIFVFEYNKMITETRLPKREQDTWISALLSEGHSAIHSIHFT
jgi:hypothetical protein